MKLSSICGVVLSAGFSSRMGRDKALLPWPVEPQSNSQAGTFLASAIARLEQVCELVIVVAGENAQTIAPLVYGTAASLVVNLEPERGQFSSLRIALQEVLNRGRDAALVALVDRPPARASTYQQLRTTFVESPPDVWAVVPEYDKQHGHPIVIGRELMELLLRAPGDSNTREVMHANQQHVYYLSVNDPLVIANINTPEDYERLRELSAGPHF